MFHRWLHSARGCALIFGSLLVALPLYIRSAPAADGFRFAILGDRTGEAQAGVYPQVWKELAAENPAFVISVGDIIQGLDDATTEAEWREGDAVHKLYRRFPFYLAPGNHDIWSPESERLFKQHTGRALHYGFDHAQAHFTILDNSRADELAPDELAFLQADLKAHVQQPIKFVIFHRPFWLTNVALRNPNFALHKLVRQYGVQYVVTGHIHQMLHLELEAVTYMSMPSSGGHLRLSGAYKDGWFFGHALVEVHDKNVEFQVKEVSEPHGAGRVTKLSDWGMTGLVKKE